MITLAPFVTRADRARPVLTWLVPEFKDTQEGTIHFHYLGADDGLLYKAETFEQHEDQLLHVLSSNEAAGRSRRFVERFVRPRGIDVAATPVLVETVVELADGKVPKAKRPLGKKITGVLVWPFSRLVRATARRLAKSGAAESAEPRPGKPERASRPTKAERAAAKRKLGPKARAREEARLLASDSADKRDA